MEKLTTTPDQLHELIRQRCADGKIFSVTFTKRTTSEQRTMAARLGVTKGVKGVGHKFDPKSHNLLCVYDINKLEAGMGEKGAFRMINLETVTYLSINGDEYKVEVV